MVLRVQVKFPHSLLSCGWLWVRHNICLLWDYLCLPYPEYTSCHCCWVPIPTLTLIRWCPQTYMDRQPGLGGPGPWFLSVLNFLVQLKNKNSSYWLLHITTALNCKIWLFFTKYLVSCEEHDQGIYGQNATKIFISAINENRFFCYIHAHSNKNYVYGGFIWHPTVVKKTLNTCIFITFLGK